MDRKYLKVASYVLIIALLLAFLYRSCRHSDHDADSVPAAATDGNQAGATVTLTTITFGNTADGCIGRGICKASNLITPTSIPVSFTKLSDTKAFFTFTLTSLEQKQPQQVPAFSQAQYIFEFPFSLNNPIFSEFNLPPGALISSSSTSDVKLVDGIVSDTVSITYSDTVTTNVIFGSKPLPGQPCQNTLKGFCSVTSNPIPSSIPVTFTLLADDASKLLMIFSKTALEGAQGAQQANFFNNNGQYMFSNAFSFTGPGVPAAIFAPLLLPPNAKIKPESGSHILLTQDNMVIDTISYTTQP